MSSFVIIGGQPKRISMSQDMLVYSEGISHGKKQLLGLNLAVTDAHVSHDSINLIIKCYKGDVMIT